MRVIVDAYGGDNAPEAVLQGCRMAADRWKCEIILTGDGNCGKRLRSWGFRWRG